MAFVCGNECRTLAEYIDARFAVMYSTKRLETVFSALVVEYYHTTGEFTNKDLEYIKAQSQGLYEALPDLVDHYEILVTTDKELWNEIAAKHCFSFAEACEYAAEQQKKGYYTSITEIDCFGYRKLGGKENDFRS